MEGIVSALAVVAIFSLVVALLTLYVWRCNPHLFKMWKAELAIWRTPLREREAKAEEAAPAPPPPATTPVGLVGKSPEARLRYWVDH